ncbi:1957_t:CDS:1, partial [Cetraspora pellucida]
FISKNKSFYALLHSKTIHFNDDQETISNNGLVNNTVAVEYSNTIKSIDDQETCSNTSTEL